MFNKNDPLIGAVQEVMKRNQAEREAAKLVNEKFGIHDRKALPHERQHEWDAAYKTVLTESVEALDEVLDSPEKRMKYGMKAIGSYVKASLTGDKNTKRKRLAGNKNLKKKVEKDTKKREEDAANNETARKILKDMGRKTGYGAIYDKMFEEEEALDENSFAALAPPYDKATQKDRLVGAGVLKKHPTQPGKHVLAKEENLDERVKENKIKKNKVIEKIGAKARKAGDPRHLNNLNGIPGGTGIREPVGDLIRGRELTSGRERRPLEEMMIKVNMEHGADHSRLEKKHNVRVVKPEDPKAKHVIHGSKENLKNFANDVYDNVSPRNIHPELFKEENLEEKITAKTDIGSAIEEFRKSDSPQLAGRSSEKRRQAAIAAVLQARRKAKKMNEGFNNRHDSSVTASVEEQVVAEVTMGGSAPAIAQRRIGASQRFRPRGAPTSTIQTSSKGPISQKPGMNTATGSLEPTTNQRRSGYSITDVRDTAYGTNPTAKRLGPASSTGGSQSPVPISKTTSRFDDSGVRRPISGTNNLQTRLANMRKNAPALDTSRNKELDQPATQSNMSRVMQAQDAAKRANMAGGGVNIPKPTLDAKAQGAKVGTSPIAKPAGSTAQPYGMNIPKKLNPDSRIAKGNVEPSVLPQTISNTTTSTAPATAAPATAAPATAKAAPTPAAPKASTMGGQMTQRDADLMARAKAGGGQELSKTFSSGADRLAYLQARAKANK